MSAPARRPDARHLDIAAFCRHGEQLAGQWPQAELSRLSADLERVAGDAPPPQVDWALRGELRPVTGGEAELWLHLQAATRVNLLCQRCLQPVVEPLALDRRLRFVRGEDEAARLDEESEDDVLALPARLDLLPLLEDEFILALPLVPRHEVCPQPLPWAAPVDGAGPATAAAANADPAAPHPFAALAALRKAGKPGGEA